MFLTVVGVVFVFVGGSIGWYGLRPLRVLPRILRSDVLDPSEISDESFVVCSGIANKSSETLLAPFSGSSCLGFEFEVTERQPFGIGIPWFQAHLDDGVATRPFTLDGPDGGVDIVPSTKRFGLDTESTVITVGSREKPPERIQRFIDVRDDLGSVTRWMQIIPGLGTRRYIERRIDPGEEYLIAGPTERTKHGVALMGDLVITDRPRRRFAISRLWSAVFPILIAAVFVVVGVEALLM